MKHFLYYLFPACMMLTACQAEDTGPIVPNQETTPEFPTLQIAKAQLVTDEVNSVEVDNILKTVFKNEPKARSEAYDVSLLTDAEGQPRIIRINYANDGGFALISAVKTYEPIIAYAPEGNFPDPENLPEPLDGMFAAAMQNIAASKDLPADSLQKIALQWRMFEQGTYGLEPPKSRYIDDEESVRLFHIMAEYFNRWQQQGYRVYELGAYNNPSADCDRMRAMAESSIYPIYLDDYLSLTFVVEKDLSQQDTKGKRFNLYWDQESEFNQSFPYKPEKPEEHIPVGCGPLAVGMVMYANQYPSYFNWSAMPTGNLGNKIVSDFLLDVFYKCNAEYIKNEGTGCYPEDRVNALKNYGYSCNLLKSLTPGDIYSQCPAIISSSTIDKNNKEGSHAWIIEQSKWSGSYTKTEVWTFTSDNSMGCVYSESSNYTNSYLFYANWGWGGRDNGFYGFNFLIPSDYKSNQLKTAIVNIKPN